MAAWMARGRNFKHFVSARYATDIIFQTIDRPVGKMQEKSTTTPGNTIMA